MDLLSNIPLLITVEENARLIVDPSMEEVQKIVFSMSADSTAGLDGFSGSFFQVCWEIIGQDLVEVMAAFFQGLSLPTDFSSTLLILILRRTTHVLLATSGR